MNTLQGFMKGGEFFHRRNNYQILKKDSVELVGIHVY
jgi:hypothetical protein